MAMKLVQQHSNHIPQALLAAQSAAGAGGRGQGTGEPGQADAKEACGVSACAPSTGLQQLEPTSRPGATGHQSVDSHSKILFVHPFYYPNKT